MEENKHIDRKAKEHAFFLGLVISIIAVLCIGWILYLNSVKSGTTAYIYKHGALIKSVELNTNRNYSFTVEGNDGGYNVIEVKNGKIAVVEASCPDHVCVSMGFISNSYIPITCLPNELVIEIKGDSSETDCTFDGVAY